MSDQQIHCVMTFDHPVVEDRIARAARLTLDAEPILSCRFVERPWRPYWERRDDPDHIEPCRLVQATDTNREVVHFLTTPIDPLDSPQVRLLLVRSHVDTLCIKMNHMVADAGGTVEYAYLLAGIYRALTEDPKYTPMPNLKGSRSLSQISRRFGIVDKVRILRRFRHEVANWSRSRSWGHWDFPTDQGDDGSYTVVVRRLGPERFRTIKEYGRQHRATVNDIMVATYYRALCDLIDPPPGVPLGLSTTVDLRRYLPSRRGAAICNLPGSASVHISRDLNAPFEDTVGRIRDEMDAQKADYFGLWGLPFYVLQFKGRPFKVMRNFYDRVYDRMTREGNIEPFFTNLGVIDKHELVFGDAEVTDAYLTAPIYYPPRFSVALSGFDESIALSFGVCPEAIAPSVVEAFFDRMESELPGSRSA